VRQAGLFGLSEHLEQLNKAAQKDVDARWTVKVSKAKPAKQGSDIHHKKPKRRPMSERTARDERL
jgi:hypothetical protein